jgi:uncharacterized protein (DUF305 family)
MDLSGYPMRPRMALWAVTLAITLATAILASAWAFAAVNDDEAAFLAENAAAMTKMMAAMAVKPAGDVDKDFVATMVPHHQGAIEMARAQIRYGRNEQLRRIAQEIIIDQTQEIAALQLAIAPEPRK